jgi:diguanylate cyclase (GGDEF)-like protein
MAGQFNLSPLEPDPFLEGDKKGMISLKVVVVLTVLLFVAGIFLGQGLYFPMGVTLLVTGAAIYATVLRHRSRQEEGGAPEKTDDPPDFVREEVIDGQTDTTMRALTPEYKRKIRNDIELAILDALGTMLEMLKHVVPYHTAALFRRGKTDVVYLFLYHSDSQNILLGEAITYGSGLVGQVMKEKEGRLIWEGDIRSPSTTLLYYKENEGIRTFLGVPITVEGVCRGVVVVDSKERQAFDDKMKRHVELFAHLAGVIQYYTYLQLENRIDRNKVTALSSLQRNFFKLGSEQEIIRMLGEILDTLVRSTRITVSLEEGKKGYGKIYYIKGTDEEYFKDYVFPFSEKGLISLVFEKNSMVKRKFDPGRYVPRFSVREKVNHEVQSILVVPIPSGNGECCIGAISLESNMANHYSQIDAENVQNLANATGLAIEKIKMLNAQTQLATIDGLTGLPNHREFQNVLEKRFKRAKRMNGEMAVIIADIDFFKKINDTHGHPVGDVILKGVADVLKGCVRKDVDFVARYGGEEFSCLLESGEVMALETAERIRQAVEKTVFEVGGQRLSVTMSFGVAIFPLDAAHKQQLIERADKALYSAKKGGRNQVKKY